MRALRSGFVSFALVASGCVAPTHTSPSVASSVAAATRTPEGLTAKAVALPGASSPASVDYIASDLGRGRIWVPVGVTGSVDVFDVASGGFSRVDGFKTAAREGRGGKRTVGPSAVAVGGGFAFIGSRATSEICPVNAATLAVGTCLDLKSPTDGVAYVTSAQEVWVTTPKESTLTVLDASKPDVLAVKASVKVSGAPEGYAVDEARGLFFTNLEDAGGTVVVDVRTHTVKATWNAGCGEEGPRGLAFDVAHDFLIVACTDHVQVLDAGHDGARLGRLDTGEGVDNIDYLEAKHALYVAAGKSARLTVARVDDAGQLRPLATATTADGARNAVADARGNAYMADGRGAKLWIVPAPAGL